MNVFYKCENDLEIIVYWKTLIDGLKRFILITNNNWLEFIKKKRNMMYTLYFVVSDNKMFYGH